MNRFITYVLCGLLAPLLAQGPVPASGGAGGNRQAHFSIKKYFGPQLPQSSLTDQPKKKRIAIIGAGIGGASAGHFLTKFTQGQTPGVSEEFDVDLFEKGDRVGGRVYSRFFGSDPEKFELGANAFVDVNYNLVNATRDYNITFKDNVGGNRSIGLYNGQDFTIKLDDTYYSKAAFYYRYGWGMFKAQRFARTIRDQFLAIYDESVPPFTSVEEAMERTKLTEYLYKTTRDVLVNEWSAGPVFADELLQAFTRNIYGSDCELHALAGGISLIAVAGSYTTENGNDQFIKAYLQSSAPTVKLHLNSPITKITRVPGDAIGGLWNRYQLDVNGLSNNVTYDAVILASPFDQASLDLRNFELPKVDLPKYRNIYVAVIQEADVNPAYFGAKKIEEIPNVVFGFNATANTPFTVFTHDTVSKIITIEATKPLTLLNLQPMIQGTLDKSQVTFKNWLAYPRMTLKKKTEPMFPPIRVAPSFYYVNAIESAISCMEVEIVSARNIARLLMDDLLEI